ncbi:MAG: hypothetical protein ACYCT1_18990 [Steroidobacteraceae bacterium]
MRKTALAGALAVLALPALALAAQPLLIRVDGRNLPMREIVEVVRTEAGPVQVRTWSWRGPGGAATLQISARHGGAAPVPAWALEQLRALQGQMRQMQLMEAALAQPMLMPAPPLPVAFGRPLLLPLPGQAPIEVRLLEPMFGLRPMPMPMRVIVIAPAKPAPRAAPVVAHHGHLV